jgi:DNA-binding NtrC family response regulator
VTEKIRVFVLDDEPNIARTWALILAKAGYDVVPFNHPQVALAALRENPPDVLVSDVGLPGMSGIDLAMILAKEKSRTKVILISGQTSTEDAMTYAAEQGYVFEVLPKPLGPATLLQVVEMQARGQSAG